MISVQQRYVYHNIHKLRYYARGDVTGMSLLQYLKRSSAVNSLPTPEETGLPCHVNDEANKSVSGALKKESAAEKKKYLTTFTAEDRAQIGKYAAENGNNAAVKKFHETHRVGESTERLFKKKYLTEINLDWREKHNTERLPAAKHGRKVLLGEELDE